MWKIIVLLLLSGAHGSMDPSRGLSCPTGEQDVGNDKALLQGKQLGGVITAYEETTETIPKLIQNSANKRFKIDPVTEAGGYFAKALKDYIDKQVRNSIKRAIRDLREEPLKIKAAPRKQLSYQAPKLPSPTSTTTTTPTSTTTTTSTSSALASKKTAEETTETIPKRIQNSANKRFKIGPVTEAGGDFAKALKLPSPTSTTTTTPTSTTTTTSTSSALASKKTAEETTETIPKRIQISANKRFKIGPDFAKVVKQVRHSIKRTIRDLREEPLNIKADTRVGPRPAVRRATHQRS